MTKPKIGVQGMMLKDKVEELGVYEVFKRIHEMGINAIEVSQIPMTPENVAEMKHAKDELGMEIASLSANVEAGPGNESLEENYDKIVEDCKTLDVDLLRIGMLPFASMKNLDTVLTFCRKANDYAVKLKEQGIKLYYHNHHVEFRKYNNERLLDIIRREAPELGFEIDVHWVQRGGVNPVQLLQEYKGKVELVHLKDYRIGEIKDEDFAALEQGDVMKFYQAFTDTIEFAELGQGVLDIKSIVEAALVSDVKYLLIEQDFQYGRDPFDCIQDSRDYLIELGYQDLF